MDSWWTALLRQQQGLGFADVAGARASVTIPVSDRLLTQVVTERLSASRHVSAVDVRALAGNRLQIQAIPRNAWLPRITIQLEIERQPEWPASPLLVLRMRGGVGVLSAVAGPALHLFDALPPGIRIDGDRVVIDLATVLRGYGGAAALDLLERLELTTVDGAVVVSAEGSVRRPAP